MAKRPSLFFDIGAQDKSGKAFSSVQDRISKAEQRAKTFGAQFMAVSAAVVGGFGAISAAALSGANDIDRAAKSARRLETDVGGFRAMELVASEAGVALGSLANDFQTLARETAAGSAGAQRAMERLGLELSDVRDLAADEQFELISDRIADMGLSAGETSALLRDLGVRNREMVLLAQQGGDALRNARRDIDDYGLALDAVDAGRIEAANDQIGRLSLITQRLQQQLALEVVPTFGRFAQAMTDSLREGGLLRDVIDGFARNLRTVVSIGGVAVTLFGVRYVSALALASFGTFTLTGALVALRTALLRTGVGALIVGAGILVDQFVQLRLATGSWGEALSALGDLAYGVWEGIKTSASALVPALGAVWQDIAAGFYIVLEDMARRFAMFLTGIGNTAFSLGWDDMAATVGGAAEKVWQSVDQFSASADQAGLAADQLRHKSGALVESGFNKARAAAARLSAIIEGNTELTTEAADMARELAAELDNLGNAGGGAGSKLDELPDKLEGMTDIAAKIKQGFGGLFNGAISGAASLGGVLDKLADNAKNLLASLSESLFNNALMGIIGNAFPSFGGALQLAGAKANGGPVKANMPYLVGERGPEIMLPSSSGSIVPNHAMGGGGQTVVVNNYSGETARQEKTQGPDGRELVTITVGEEISKGTFSRQMQSRHGVGQRRVKR